MADRLLFFTTIVLPLVFASPQVVHTSKAEPSKNIVELGVSNKDFSILVQLVKTADLVDALSDSSASLTLFAPTSNAFRLLARDVGFKGNFHDEGAVISFLSGAIGKLAESSGVTLIALLQNILKYHVIPESSRVIVRGCVVRPFRSLLLGCGM